MVRRLELQRHSSEKGGSMAQGGESGPGYVEAYEER